MDAFQFSEEEKKRLEKFIEIYSKTKIVIIKAEESKIDLVKFFSPIEQLRNALDHLMRVFEVKGGGKNEDSANYCLDNLDAAIAHVYRACYDALDFSVHSLKEKIQTEFKGFDSEVILQVMPEYYSSIKPKLEKFCKEIEEIRNNKDIAKIRHSEDKNIEKYLQLWNDLNEDYKKMLDKQSTLIEQRKEIKNKRKKEERKNWIMAFVVGIIMLILGIVLGKIL
ncbi:MAG: hypothetical protein CVT89_04970 [Candidatus Altiarchaeales archaeon HGW-Altiarchaeales-2]|nr:MAG: hypothetical protein CVT89_04970 [Candidatus Altiarchaeales archaeon HGW-Altiarchaeales-2]